MTKLAQDFNAKYNLSLSPAAFEPVTAGDTSNDIVGKPQSTIIQAFKRFFSSPVAVISVIVFLGIFILSIVLPIVSDYSSRKTVNTVLGEKSGVMYLPSGGTWKTIPLSSVVLDRIRAQGLVEGVDYVISTDTTSSFSTPFLSYDVWKYVAARNPGMATSSILGTDNDGFDIWTRIWDGTWESLKLSLLVGVVATIVGTILGSWIAFYFGGFIDILVLKLIEAYSSVPETIWLFILLIFFPKNFWGLFGYFMLSGWIVSFGTARINMIRILSLDFLKSAKTTGLSLLSRALRHGLPNYIGLIAIAMASLINSVIIEQAYISLFGLDFDPTTPTLGSAFTGARSNISGDQLNLGYVLMPAFIFLAINMSTRFIAFGVNDAINPKFGKR